MKGTIRNGFAAAAAKILDALGRKSAGEIVSRSPSLVYKWSDPGLANSPTVAQALEMDVEYVRGGHGAPPFLTIYSELLKDQVHRPRPSRKAPPHQFTAETIRLLEEVVALLKAVQVRKSVEKNDEVLDASGTCGICRVLRNCRDIAAGLAWSIESDETGAICPIRRGPEIPAACLLANQTE